MKKNIEKIVEKNLCCGCGTCSSTCPQQAITMVRNTAGFLVPEVDHNKCNDCGICLLTCPGNGLPEDLTNRYDDIFRGNNIAAYIGRATDEELWKNGQSGGVVSALLMYLLENKIIDKAVVNSFNPKTNKPIVTYVKDREGLIKSQGSYYSQSAVNEKAINNTSEKTAAVVLGCQAQGIALSKKYTNKGTPDYLIGLVCTGNHSNLIIDDLIEQSGLESEKTTEFRFKDKRAGGWPGNILIKTNDQQKIMDKKKRMILKDIYGVYRCQCCFDKMNIFSDIVVGDPWGIEAEDKKGGLSVFIIRTEKGQDLINKAIDNKYLIADKIDINSVYKGQKIDSTTKTKFFGTKEICKKENFPFPDYNIDWSKYKYRKASKSLKRHFSKLLKYKFYLYNVENRSKLNKIIRKQKRLLALKNTLLKSASLVKHSIKRIFRLFTKKI